MKVGSVWRFVRAFSVLAFVALFGAAACHPPSAAIYVPRDKCHVGLQTPGLRTVSWRELVDDPIAFEGRRVRIVGRLQLQFENYSFSPPDARSGPFWIYLGDAIDEELATKACSGALVALEGELDLERSGHGASAGAIVARRIDALQLDEPDPIAPPQIPVTAIDPHVVTVAEYDVCVRAGACKDVDDRFAKTAACNSRRSERRAFPMNCVRWVDAARYCAWAGKRLPTEQEWFSAVGVEPPAEVPELPMASKVLAPDAETRAVDAGRRDVVTNGVAEWTRSSVRTKRCIEFDRVIVRDPAMGEPLRRRGVVGWPATRSADLGFRCAR